MICAKGHEMYLHDVETAPAHQEGGNIVDATQETMWVCSNPNCDEVEPITNEEDL